MTRKTTKAKNISGEAQCQICKNKTFLVTHHIRGRDVPNPNHFSNLANICDCCHRSIHMGKIIIEGWFMTTAGLELFWHEKTQESFTGEKITPHIIKPGDVS